VFGGTLNLAQLNSTQQSLDSRSLRILGQTHYSAEYEHIIPSTI